MRALDIASTGMQSQQLNVEVISNNIANLNTTGYKRQRAEFQDLLYQKHPPSGRHLVRCRHGRAGRRAGRPGRKDGGGLSHPRAGQPQPDPEPARSRDPGRGLLPGAPAGRHDGLYPRRLVPAEQLPPDRDGRRLSGAADHLDPAEHDLDHGQCARARCWPRSPARPRRRRSASCSSAIFANNPGLAALGQNLLQETQASGNPSTVDPGVNSAGTIQQGFLETSNVNVVTEISKPDHRPARLRNELEGHRGCRPDAADADQPALIRILKGPSS